MFIIKQLPVTPPPPPPLVVLVDVVLPPPPPPEVVLVEVVEEDVLDVVVDVSGHGELQLPNSVTVTVVLGYVLEQITV